MANIWQFRGDTAFTPTKEQIEAAEGSPLLAKLLASRGLTDPQAIRDFLRMEDYQPSSGWELPDMEPAVERILKAIETQEPILIYGDFDVDGITGTSVLYETLKLHLNANVSFYIPDRATEGHGLNTAALVRLTSSRRIKLVITTDTGITNFSEVSLLNGLGVDTIVTDHHALPENLPPALANINSQRLLASNPQHPLGLLCGAGVAFKLCELLLEKRLPLKEAGQIAESLLDIVAVGTVVDMVPLLRENRYLVYRGLQVLNRRKRLGFSEILEQAGCKPDARITSETLGFTIGPRLNALGRLERADQGVELITTADPQRARVIASHLEHLNRKRRDLCDQTFLEAETHLQQIYGGSGLGDHRAIVLASPDWNPGIIGIVASRLIEKYHVPVFMMVVDEGKAEARCSARSIPGFHLHDELLALEEYFLHFGGHAGAGGFALKLERLEALKKQIHEICGRKVTEEQMKPVIDVDARLEWTQLNPHLVELIGKMAPFGMDNPPPKFVIENVTVAAQRNLGEDERHAKLLLTRTADRASANTPVEALIWNFNKRERFDARTPYSFVVVPELNTFNGNTKVQLIIEDYQSAAGTAKVVAPAFQTVKTSVQGLLADDEPTAAEDIKADPVPSGTQWIDHRGREAVEAFIGQLLLPLQDRRQVLVYHEGRKPDIPFVNEKLLCNRRQAHPADELVFWDLPPSAGVFHQILENVQPEVIHLVGGKYQSVPVYPTEHNYLKLLIQVLRRTGSSEVEVSLAEMATQLATTETVVTHGLILLGSMGMVQSRILSPDNSDGLKVRLLGGGPDGADIADRLEYSLFGQSLREVGKFRGWLLKSPLATIKASLQSPAALPESKAEPGPVQEVVLS